MEPASRGRGRPAGDERRQLRQYPAAGRDPLAARQVRGAIRGGSDRRPLAHDERRLQALRPGALPGDLPHRRHHPDRVRHRGHPVGHLQWLSGLHCRVPLRRDRHQRRLQHGPEVHALLRPASGRYGARVLPGLPHGLDPVRAHPGAQGDGPDASAPAARTGREPGPSLRRGREVPRWAQLLLSPGGRAGSVRSSAVTEGSHAEPAPRFALLHGGRRGARPARVRGSAEAADGRAGRRE